MLDNTKENKVGTGLKQSATIKRNLVQMRLKWEAQNEVLEP